MSRRHTTAAASEKVVLPLLLLLMVALTYQTPAGLPRVSPCPEGFTVCAGQCYALQKSAVEYKFAMSRCTDLGSTLAIPRTHAENLCVAGLSDGNRVWLGVTDHHKEGVFLAQDSTPEEKLDGHSWFHQQPDDSKKINPIGEDCVEMLDAFADPNWAPNASRFSKWNDENCNSHRPFMCELQSQLTDMFAEEHQTVSLPCDVTPLVADDELRSVHWFHGTMCTPMYTYDTRDQPAGIGSHWSDRRVDDSRVRFVPDSSPAALRINRVQRSDQRLYRCRADFLQSPTRYSLINLTIIIKPGAPTPAVMPDRSGISANDSSGDSDDLNHGPPKPTSRFLPDNCGIRSMDQFGSYRVVHSSPVKIFDYPWQAQIQNISNAKHICGGIIISDRHILTAAHCLTDHLISRLQVVVGQNDLNEEDAEEEVFAVKERYLHPEYNDDSWRYSNDIAILLLGTRRGPIKFGHCVQPACLPTINGLSARPERAEELTDCLVSGWGRISNGSLPTLLYGATILKVSSTYCGSTEVWGGKFNGTGQLCAGDIDQGVDTCEGDSGGPLACRDEWGRWTVNGIVSWGSEDCGKTRRVGVYTRVSTYVDWITKVLEFSNISG